VSVVLKKAAGRAGAALQNRLAAMKMGHEMISSVGKSSPGSLTCPSAAQVHTCMDVCHAQCLILKDCVTE